MRMKEEGRAAILDAAEAVMSEQGLRSARMEDIAARVGVAVGTLYNYFKDRQQLLDALLDVRGRELLVRLDAELDRSQGAPYRERLGAFLRCILEHSRSHFRLFSVLFEEGMRHGATSDRDLPRYQEMWSEVSRRIDALNADGIRQGALRPEDRAHYPTLVLNLVQGLIFGQVLAKQPLPADEAIALLLRSFLDGAAPRPTQSPKLPRR